MVDRQDVVLRPMGEKKTRASSARKRDDKSRRESQDMREEVAIGEAEGDGVSGGIGESADSEMGRIDVHRLEGCLQRLVDETEIGPGPAAARGSCLALRLHRDGVDSVPF